MRVGSSNNNNYHYRDIFIIIVITITIGRTAVHWAAMINNVDALRLLIKQGPDNVKDAPNHKGETALFLACREGCLGAVRHLLDCYANATLVDSLERSPLHIAYEKQNIDVIDMLQQSTQGPLGGPSPPMYPMKPHHSVTNQMFGRNGSSIKIEPAHIPTMIPSQPSSVHDAYRFQNGLQSDGMTRCSSIEAELERLVNSTQYPPMINCYSSGMMYTSEPHPITSQTHILNTSPSTVDGGHSPGHSIISPLGGGMSPGDSNSTDHTFSPGSTEVYSTNIHTSSPGSLVPYSCANNSIVSPSSGQQLLTGSTPLQHLPTTFVEGGSSVLPTSSVGQSTIPTGSNNSPLMCQTVSPNPSLPQATINGGYTSLQLTTDNHSPSSHYGFPSPPKEAGEYGTYGTPYNGDNVNSINSMTPSPEDGSSRQVDNSPLSQQYTTIHGQYSYSSDPYHISLQPCNAAAIRTSHFPGLSTAFNPKESTV